MKDWAFTHAPGWAVEITGKQEDLDNLRKQLADSSAIWIEPCEWVGGPWLLLRNKEWQRFDYQTEPSVLFKEAQQVLEIINGSMSLIYGNSNPIAAKGGVNVFEQEGRHRRWLVASITVNIVAPPIELQPEENELATPLQCLLRIAATDEVSRALIAHINRADNWDDVYKASELIRKLAGGHPASETALGGDLAEFKRLCHTANYEHRHAPGTVRPPTKPMDLGTAKNLLVKIAPRFLR